MTKTGGAAGSCSTCAFCQGAEMFAKSPRPHVPMCGKYMWLMTGDEKTNCSGWKSADALSAREAGDE